MKHINEKQWEYGDTKTYKCGTMICTHCKIKITSGEFRFYETDESYHCQHRACSAKDIEWSRIDKIRAENISYLQMKLNAYKEFRDKWGDSDISDEIYSLKKILSNPDSIAHYALDQSIACTSDSVQCRVAV